MSFDLANHAAIYAPDYGEHAFSDHMPMAVTALRKLGANEGEIDAFVASYKKRLRRKKIGVKSIDPAFVIGPDWRSDCLPASL